MRHRSLLDEPLISATLKTVWTVTGRGVEPFIVMGAKEYETLCRLVSEGEGERFRPRGFFSLWLLPSSRERCLAVVEPRGEIHWVHWEPSDFEAVAV